MLALHFTGVKRRAASSSLRQTGINMTVDNVTLTVV
jgi:hypothetical protein